MATNLLLLYPDIPQSATRKITYTNSTSEAPYDDDDSPFLNSFRGERYQFWKSDRTATKSEHNGRYDLGSTVTKSVNFCVLSRLDILRALSASTTIDFKLQSSSDDSTYTDRHTITDITTATLKGPWANDYATTFTATSAFRYWRAKFVKSTGSNFDHTIGKVYFGTALDLGRDPVPVSIERHKRGNIGFTTSGGILYPGRINNPTYELRMRWEGVTDANVQTFYENIARKIHTTTFFLYTQGPHNMLDGHQCLHVKMDDPVITQEYYDYNTIDARFIETHG